MFCTDLFPPFVCAILGQSLVTYDFSTDLFDLYKEANLLVNEGC